MFRLNRDDFSFENDNPQEPSCRLMKASESQRITMNLEAVAEVFTLPLEHIVTEGGNLGLFGTTQI